MKKNQYQGLLKWLILGGLAAFTVGYLFLFTTPEDSLQKTPTITEQTEAVETPPEVSENMTIEMPERIDDKVVDKLVDSLKEDERYILVHHSAKNNDVISSQSDFGPIRVNTLEALKERVSTATLEIYVPQYIPEGFSLQEADVYYYINYDNFDLAMQPIREEKLGERSVFKVYQMKESYAQSIDQIYLRYTNGSESITYRFGLSFSSGSHAEGTNNQFVKEAYDLSSVDSQGLRVNQKIEPQEVFFSIPDKAYYNSPDYFESIEMSISSEGISQEELVKIANSLYKIN